MDLAENPFARPILVARIVGAGLAVVVALLGALTWLIMVVNVAPSDWSEKGTVTVLGSLGLGMVVLGLVVNAAISQRSVQPSAYCTGACVALWFALLASLEGFIATVTTHSPLPYAVAASLAGVVLVGLWPREAAWRRWQGRRMSRIAARADGH